MARLSDINTVFQKELLYIVRDARTLLLTALIPILFMPLLLLGPQMAAHQTMSDVESTKGVVLLSPDNAFLRKKLAAADVVCCDEIDDPLEALRSGKIDVWLEPPGNFDRELNYLQDKSKQPILNVRYDGRQLNSFISETKVVKALLEVREELKKQRLNSLGVPDQEDILKVNWQTVPLNKKFEAVGVVAMTVPPILLFMILVALMYPSIDLITGERERGTMPLLVVACINHTDIMIGKMAAIAVIGQTSVLLGLISLFFCLNVYVSHNYSRFGILTSITPVAFFGVFVMAVPLVILYTCFTVLLAGMCRKFQQAQGYFLPFVALTMMPAAVSSMQGIQLDTAILALPVCGSIIGMRDLLTGNFQLVWLVAAWILGLIYAAVVFIYTCHLLDREAAMSEGTTPAIVRRRGGNFRPEAALLLSCCFLLMFYGGQVAQAQDALTGVLLSQLLFIAGPAIACLVLLKQPVLKTLSLVRPRLDYLAAALLLSPAVAMLSMGIGAVQSLFLPIPASYAQAFLNVVIQPGRPLWLIIAVFALLPALCEELLFRGALQGLLRKTLPPRVLIPVIGIAFGIFHLSSFRFLPTATMGIVLSALTVLSGSIFPAMLLHGLHNTYLIIFEYYKVNSLTPFQIVAGLVSAAAGVAVIIRVRSARTAN